MGTREDYIGDVFFQGKGIDLNLRVKWSEMFSTSSLSSASSCSLSLVTSLVTSKVSIKFIKTEAMATRSFSGDLIKVRARVWGIPMTFL